MNFSAKFILEVSMNTRLDFEKSEVTDGVCTFKVEIVEVRLKKEEYVLKIRFINLYSKVCKTVLFIVAYFLKFILFFISCFVVSHHFDCI